MALAWGGEPSTGATVARELLTISSSCCFSPRRRKPSLMAEIAYLTILPLILPLSIWGCPLGFFSNRPKSPGVSMVGAVLPAWAESENGDWRDESWWEELRAGDVYLYQWVPSHSSLIELFDILTAELKWASGEFLVYFHGGLLPLILHCLWWMPRIFVCLCVESWKWSKCSYQRITIIIN